MEQKQQIVLHCVFCNSTQFEYNENNLPKDGDMIKCRNCGRLNDLSSIKKLALDNKVIEIKHNLTNEFQRKLNKIIKKF